MTNEALKESVEFGDESRELRLLFFYELELTFTHPTYSSLYDLYVYKLNATDEMLDSMTNWAFKKKCYKDNVMLPYVSMTNET
jgi:hypothetical protein